MPIIIELEHTDRQVLEALAAGFNEIERKLNLLIGGETAIIKKDHQIMTVLSDIQDAEAQTLVQLTAETDARVAAKASLDAQTAKITNQIAALQAGGNNDPALQTILDNAKTILAQTDTQALAEAALANTSAAGTGAVPVIDSVNPGRVAFATGEPLTILGSGFLNASAVTINGSAVTPFTVNSDVSISLSAPPGSQGTSASVVVTTPLGDSNSGTFSYI